MNQDTKANRRRASLASFRTDPRASADGVWLNFVTGEQELDPRFCRDLCVKIARMGNPKYQAAIMRSGAAMQSAVDVGNSDATNAKAEAVTRECVAKHILVGWSNLYDGDGEDAEIVPYSQEKALEIINDPSYVDFYEAVLRMSRRQELFRHVVKESDAGNSSQS